MPKVTIEGDDVGVQVPSNQGKKQEVEINASHQAGDIFFLDADITDRDKLAMKYVFDITQTGIGGEPSAIVQMGYRVADALLEVINEGTTFPAT